MARAPKPVSFRTREAFREWLQEHHSTASELVLRCYKVHAAHRGIGYREGLDEALCFGWIDGVRQALDSDSFTVRFTPRKAKSYWSAVNTKRYRELIAERRMRAPGRKAFAARANRDGSTRYSFESRVRSLSPEFTKALRANRKAWAFYAKQAPWYRRTSAFWVMSAAREDTRRRRFATLLEDSAEGRTIKPLTRKPTAARRKK